MMNETLKLEDEFDLIEASKRKTVFFLPKFLVSIFLIEMWERFSYYGMRALLVVYLISFLNFEDTDAYTLFSIYGSMGYFLPLVGGFVADKIWGFSQSVIVGAIIIFLGHCTLAVSFLDNYFTYLGLGLISVGTGFFKGNMNNILGLFYDTDSRIEKKRNSGFTLFYVGVNLGAFLSTTACVACKEYYGTHVAFALAGFGMLIGLMVLLYNKKLFDKIEKKALIGEVPKLSVATKENLIWKKVLIFIGVVITLLLITTLLKESTVVVNFFSSLSTSTKKLIVISLISLIVLFVFYLLFSLDKKQERKNVMLLFIFFFFNFVFFVYEMQTGSLFNLFFIRHTHNNFLGINIPGEMSQSINPFVVMTFGIFLSSGIFKNNLGKKYDFLRVLLALLSVNIYFVIIYLGCVNADLAGYSAYIYPFTSVVIMSIGEVLISPFTIAKTTELAPKSLKGFFMGINILFLALSNLGGIFLGQMFAVPKGLSLPESLAIYEAGFLSLIKINIFVTIAFVALIPLMIWLVSNPKSNTKTIN